MNRAIDNQKPMDLENPIPLNSITEYLGACATYKILMLKKASVVVPDPAEDEVKQCLKRIQNFEELHFNNRPLGRI